MSDDTFLGRCQHCLDSAFLDRRRPCIDRFTGQPVPDYDCLVLIARKAERKAADRIEQLEAEIESLRSALVASLKIEALNNDYCAQCFGPCRRRPRHGEIGI
jgi:hypothetical protein